MAFWTMLVPVDISSIDQFTDKQSSQATLWCSVWDHVDYNIPAGVISSIFFDQQRFSSKTANSAGITGESKGLGHTQA